MKRTKRLKPGGYLKRRVRVRPRTPKTAAEVREQFAYEFGSEQRVEWLRWHPCVGCARVPCENHHTRADGRGKKGHHTSLVPLCFDCHRAVHTIGVKSFERSRADFLCGRTLREWADYYARAWDAWNTDGLQPIAGVIAGLLERTEGEHG